MSTLSKTLMAAAVVVPLLFAGRQANEAFRLEAENQRLHRTADALMLPAIQSSRETNRKDGEPGKERAQQLRNATVESIRRQMALAERGLHEYHVEYSLIEKGGKGLTSGAAKAAGLNNEEQEAVSGILINTWTRVADDFARRAVLVEEDSDEKTGRTVYMIAARPDRGREFKDQLLCDLESAVGISKLAILMKGFQRDDFLGGFGAQDVRLEFLITKGEFKFAFLNPLNGEPNCFGSHPMNEFKDQFGDSFEVPEFSASPRDR